MYTSATLSLDPTFHFSNFPLLQLSTSHPSHPRTLISSILISYHVRYAFASVPLAFASYIGSLLFFTIAYCILHISYHPSILLPNIQDRRLPRHPSGGLYSSRYLHLYYKRLHDHYGDVIRVGQHALLLSQTLPAIISNWPCCPPP